MKNCSLNMAYKNTVHPTSTLYWYVSHQIIKGCNSIAIVLFSCQNSLHECINVRLRPGKLQSNNCHLEDDDWQAEPRLSILSNNQGTQEGINSIHLGVGCWEWQWDNELLLPVTCILQKRISKQLNENSYWCAKLFI